MTPASFLRSKIIYKIGLRQGDTNTAQNVVTIGCAIPTLWHYYDSRFRAL